MSSARPTTYSTRPSASSMTSSRLAYAISGSTIQNSVRCRRVLDFSARNVGPKQYTRPERHRVGLVVQLPALREVRGGVLEVLHREQVGRALAGRRREDRRVAEDEVALVEEVANRVDHLVPHAQDRLLPRRADPEVTPIEQVVDAMFLRRDGEVVRFVMDVEADDVDLVAARRARVGAHGAGHRERRLLREVVGLLERLLADGRLRHHRLDEAAAVAHLEEVNLPARAAVVQPSVDGDLLRLRALRCPGCMPRLYTDRNRSSLRRADCARSSTRRGVSVAASSNSHTPS